MNFCSFWTDIYDLNIFEFFAQNAFFRHCRDFQAGYWQISLNLDKKASATWQLAFLPLALCFTTFWLRHAKKSKFWDKKTKWSTSFQVRLLYFLIFFRSFFFPFSFLFAAVIGLLLGLLAVKKLQRKRHRDEQFYHGVATCKGRKFCPEFFTQLFVHISGAFMLRTLIWVLLERSHVQKLSIDDANFGQKWWQQKWKTKARHGRCKSQWGKAELQNSKINAAI